MKSTIAIRIQQVTFLITNKYYTIRDQLINLIDNRFNFQMLLSQTDFILIYRLQTQEPKHSDVHIIKHHSFSLTFSCVSNKYNYIKRTQQLHCKPKWKKYKISNLTWLDPYICTYISLGVEFYQELLAFETEFSDFGP